MERFLSRTSLQKCEKEWHWHRIVTSSRPRLHCIILLSFVLMHSSSLEVVLDNLKASVHRQPEIYSAMMARDL